MALLSIEELSGHVETAISRVWDAEWARADTARAICDYINWDKPTARALMKHIGRSSQDLFRWAELARAFPEEVRHKARSPRWHVGEMK
jgi:hypothetical protein